MVGQNDNVSVSIVTRKPQDLLPIGYWLLLIELAIGLLVIELVI